MQLHLSAVVWRAIASEKIIVSVEKTFDEWVLFCLIFFEASCTAERHNLSSLVARASANASFADVNRSM